MILFKAYTDAFKKWKRWDGRTRRRDYWWFMVGHALVSAILSTLMFLATGRGALDIITIFLYWSYSIVSIVPSIAVTIRRLHDTDRSGYYYFISWIPVIGTIWFIILMATVGDYGDNKYGEDPKAEFFRTGKNK